MLGKKEAFDQAKKLVAQGSVRAAYQTTQQLYAKDPYFPPIVALHVSVIMRLGKPEEGAMIARRSLKHITHKPHRVAVLNTLAEGLTRTGNLDDAISLLRDEIVRQPRVPSLVSGLGHMLLLSGNKEEAIGIVERSVDEGMKSLEASAIFGRAVLRSDREGEAIEMIEGLLNDGQKHSPSSVRKAQNSIGHLYDRAGRYGEAMVAFTAAKEHSMAAYDDASVLGQVESLRGAWKAEGFEGLVRPETGMPRPVFILGMPRSGTTLTEQIIDSHPLGFGAGELGLISELFWRAAPGKSDPYSLGPGDFEPEKIVELAKVYRQETMAMAGDGGVEVITDKAPMNFWHMGLIALAFPDARIIHCRREPRDNCLSCFFESLNTIHSYSYGLESCGKFYRHYRSITDHFTTVLSDDRVGVPIFENQYEDTVADQEGKTRALLDFVGLEFDEACLDFHKSGRVALTLSNEQVRQPIYTSSTKRYERYAGHIDDLNKGLGDLIGD